VVGALDGLRDVHRPVRLDAPLDVGSDELDLLSPEERLGPDDPPILLSRRDHQRRLGVPRRGDHGHGVANAGGGVEVDDGGVVARERVPHGHRRHGALVEAEDVAEVFREARQEG